MMTPYVEWNHNPPINERIAVAENQLLICPFVTQKLVIFLKINKIS